MLLWVVACGGEAAPPSEPEPEAITPGLAGVWKTSGMDPTFGAVDVEMALGDDGELSMTLVLEGGARRSFPGTWVLQGDELVLRGAYFEPEGESRVRWRLEEDGVLVLEDGEGARQEWRRG